MKGRPRFKQQRSHSLAVVKNCVKCGCRLKPNNKHHYLCQKDWEEEQLAKGNLALIGGVK
jgi:hypothetical protein